MSGMVFTEEQLKKAVEEFAEELYADLPVAGPDPEFSDNYQARKRQFIAMARDSGEASGSTTVSTKRRGRRVLRTVAAVLGILIISFAILMVASPKAYAAVRDWTINIYNKIVDYTFNHSEDDHAVIVCEPAGLPEGFERAETYHSGYYTRKLYKNAETGDYIRFEYRKPTKAQIANIEKRGQKAESVTAANGVPMCFAAGNPNELFWYDKDRNLVFYVESDLSKDSLLDCFASVNYRLPLYEPSWLPEGYGLSYEDQCYPSLLKEYIDQNNSMLNLDIYDMAEVDIVNIWSRGDDVNMEECQINKTEAKYYPATETDPGSGIVWIDEKNHLVCIFTTDSLSKEELIRFSESVQCVETEW